MKPKQLLLILGCACIPILFITFNASRVETFVPTPTECIDGDQDGYCVEDDCNDNDPKFQDFITYWYDEDGDGFGRDDVGYQGCEEPSEHYVIRSDDPDDSDPSIIP